jgi:hypothetical protein
MRQISTLTRRPVAGQRLAKTFPRQQIRRQPLVREGAPPPKTKQKLSNTNKYLVMSPGRGSIPRQTDWQTVSRTVTVRLTEWRRNPCGGEVEYLHREPASRRRRRKGKSQISDSKIWPRVPRDSDQRKTALAKTSSIYKRQTHPLVREGAPQKEDGNCQRVICSWSWAPDGARRQDLLIDWPSVAMWLGLGIDSSVGGVVWSEVDSVQSKIVLCEIL